MQFIDTNVLLYSIADDPGEARKRDIAIAILRGKDLALSVQVLQEFYVQATRSNWPWRISHAHAVRLIEGWSRFPVQDMTQALLFSALDIKARHRFSYWDSAIIAAARALGCDDLLTEDLSHGRIVEGVAIVNPFRKG
jgi:predicted nucleic acid-binding protein